MEIIDPHHHFWNLEDLKYEWLKGPNQLKIHLAGDLAPVRHTYGPSEFKKDAEPFVLKGSVHVQAECADALGEVQWMQSLHDQHGLPSAVVAHADLASPTLAQTLEAYSKFNTVKGIRQLANWRPGGPNMCEYDLLSDAKWKEGLASLSKYGLSFDLQVWHQQLKQAATVVQATPHVNFILNHTGMPANRTEETFKEWKEGMFALAALPNISVKISGLGMTDHNWSVDSFKPYVLTTIEIFGVDRCMFASNFPIDKLLSSYVKLYSAFKEIVSHLPAVDQAKLFHDNAIKYYRLDKK
eukprot:TRINITY_DN1426_c0_g1_i1.p1 TRINITY_DN1426_c0_g1~~TRINITY_DN1426_c0_g1_i1.p1  ORF type:complete len:297 (+),score=70.20 TRINITY_DN1426_c0_g1_i1:95-985(+)